MAMNLLIIAGLLLILLTGSASAQQFVITADIEEELQGSFASIQFDSSPLQHLTVFWENTGSISCAARARIDYINSTTNKRVHTVWSESKTFLPGSGNRLDTIADLDSGSYYARVRIYHCFETTQDDNNNISFIVEPRKVENTTLEILSVKTFDDVLEVSIKSRQNLDSIVVFSPNAPLGWIIEHTHISEIKKDERRTVRIPYQASVFKETSIVVAVATEDGKHKAQRVVLLQKNQEDYRELLMFVLILAIATIVILLRKMTR